MDTITLFCLVLVEDINNAFPVAAEKSETIGVLKDLIMEKNHLNSMKSRVSISIEDTTTIKNHNLSVGSCPVKELHISYCGKFSEYRGYRGSSEVDRIRGTCEVVGYLVVMWDRARYCCGGWTRTVI